MQGPGELTIFWQDCFSFNLVAGYCISAIDLHVRGAFHLNIEQWFVSKVVLSMIKIMIIILFSKFNSINWAFALFTVQYIPVWGAVVNNAAPDCRYVRLL